MKTSSLTRRRLGAGLAALTGLAVGFPSRALACKNTQIGDFDVGRWWIDDDPGVGIAERNGRRGDIGYFVKLMSDSAEFFVSLYSEEEDIRGLRYDLIFRFNDGTTLIQRFDSSHISPKFSVDDEWHHLVIARPQVRSPLFEKFMHANSMDIEAIDLDANRSVATGRGFSLKGSRKAANYAAYMVLDCPPGTPSTAGAGATGEVDPALAIGGEFCFLTTACVDDLGLADDCWELRSLRRFRDDVMARTEKGRAQAALYRELAPAILAALPAGQRSQILRAVYGRYIVPSAIAARLGLNGLAHRIYVRLMLTMLRRFAPGLLTGRRAELAALFGRRL